MIYNAHVITGPVSQFRKSKESKQFTEPGGMRFGQRVERQIRSVNEQEGQENMLESFCMTATENLGKKHSKQAGYIGHAQVN